MSSEQKQPTGENAQTMRDVKVGDIVEVRKHIWRRDNKGEVRPGTKVKVRGITHMDKSVIVDIEKIPATIRGDMFSDIVIFDDDKEPPLKPINQVDESSNTPR